MEQKILQPSSVWVLFIPGMSQTLLCLVLPAPGALAGIRTPTWEKGRVTPKQVQGSFFSRFSSLSHLCHSFLEKREFRGNLP